MSKNNTKHNKKRRLNPLVFVALVICALAVIYSATGAWLTNSIPNPIRFTTLEDFDYQMNVYFVGEDNITPAKMVAENYNCKSGALDPIEVDFSNPSATDYVGKLRVAIKQVGSGVAYTRVRISHEWVNSISGRLQGDSYLPYTVAGSFVDKRDSDSYVYFNGAMPANGDYTVVFNNFDAASFDVSTVSALSGETKLLINVSVDAVQFNRYQQIWGMDTIPWRS